MIIKFRKGSVRQRIVHTWASVTAGRGRRIRSQAGDADMLCGRDHSTYVTEHDEFDTTKAETKLKVERHETHRARLRWSS